MREEKGERERERGVQEVAMAMAVAVAAVAQGCGCATGKWRSIKGFYLTLTSSLPPTHRYILQEKLRVRGIAYESEETLRARGFSKVSATTYTSHGKCPYTHIHNDT
jgi:hypothetical protein